MPHPPDRSSVLPILCRKAFQKAVPKLWLVECAGVSLLNSLWDLGFLRGLELEPCGICVRIFLDSLVPIHVERVLPFCLLHVLDSHS